MKKVIILCAFIAAFATTSFGQTDKASAPVAQETQKHKKGGKKAKKAAVNIKKELNLTAEQEAKMKTVGGTYKGKVKAVKTDNTIDKQQKKAQLLEIEKARDAEMKGILDANQYAKLTALKKERRDKMKNRKH